MATCRECLHQVLCDTYSRMGVTDVPADDITICELFKPKSDYVKRERGEWISVKDRLPETEGEYLCYFNSSYGSYMKLCRFSFNLKKVDRYDFYDRERCGWYNYNSEYGYYEDYDVAYWQPLPEPPELLKGGGDNDT